MFSSTNVSSYSMPTINYESSIFLSDYESTYASKKIATRLNNSILDINSFYKLPSVLDFTIYETTLTNKEKRSLIVQLNDKIRDETKDIDPAYRQIAEDNFDDLLWT